MAENDGAEHIVETLRQYFAPETVNSIKPEVARLPQFRRKEQTIDGNIVEFYLLQRKGESKMRMGAGLPEAFVSAPRMHSSAPSRHEKSQVLAGTHRSLPFSDVTMSMRR